MNKLTIEIMAHCVDDLLRQLEDNDYVSKFHYHGLDAEVPDIAEVWVDTQQSEMQLATWLSSKPGLHYIGVYERRATEDIPHEN